MQQQQQQQVEQEQQQHVATTERRTDRQKRLCLHFLLQLLVSSLHKQEQSVSCPQKNKTKFQKKWRENKKCIRKFIHKTSENNNSSRYTVIDMKIHSFIPLSVSLFPTFLCLSHFHLLLDVCVYGNFLYILCTVVGLLPHAKNFSPSPALVFILLLCHKMHSGREQYIFFFWGLSLVRRLSKRGKYVWTYLEGR